MTPVEMKPPVPKQPEGHRHGAGMEVQQQRPDAKGGLPPVPPKFDTAPRVHACGGGCAACQGCALGKMGDVKRLRVKFDLSSEKTPEEDAKLTALREAAANAQVGKVHTIKTSEGDFFGKVTEEGMVEGIWKVPSKRKKETTNLVTEVQDPEAKKVEHKQPPEGAKFVASEKQPEQKIQENPEPVIPEPRKPEPLPAQQVLTEKNSVAERNVPTVAPVVDLPTKTQVPKVEAQKPAKDQKRVPFLGTAMMATQTTAFGERVKRVEVRVQPKVVKVDVIPQVPKPQPEIATQLRMARQTRRYNPISEPPQKPATIDVPQTAVRSVSEQPKQFQAEQFARDMKRSFAERERRKTSQGAEAVQQEISSQKLSVQPENNQQVARSEPHASDLPSVRSTESSSMIVSNLSPEMRQQIVIPPQESAVQQQEIVQEKRKDRTSVVQKTINVVAEKVKSFISTGEKKRVLTSSDKFQRRVVVEGKHVSKKEPTQREEQQQPERNTELQYRNTKDAKKKHAARITTDTVALDNDFPVSFQQNQSRVETTAVTAKSEKKKKGKKVRLAERLRSGEIKKSLSAKDTKPNKETRRYKDKKIEGLQQVSKQVKDFVTAVIKPDRTKKKDTSDQPVRKEKKLVVDRVNTLAKQITDRLSRKKKKETGMQKELLQSETVSVKNQESKRPRKVRKEKILTRLTEAKGNSESVQTVKKRKEKTKVAKEKLVKSPGKNEKAYSKKESTIISKPESKPLTYVVPEESTSMQVANDILRIAEKQSHKHTTPAVDIAISEHIAQQFLSVGLIRKAKISELNESSRLTLIVGNERYRIDTVALRQIKTLLSAIRIESQFLKMHLCYTQTETNSTNVICACKQDELLRCEKISFCNTCHTAHQQPSLAPVIIATWLVYKKQMVSFASSLDQQLFA